MDDSLEEPTSNIRNLGKVDNGYDSQNSDDEDDAPDWTKFQALAKASSSSSKPVIPKRGDKEFEPTGGLHGNEVSGNASGSVLQQYKLDRARSAMFNTIDVERTSSSKAISYALWDPCIARALVLRGQGIHLNTMGYSAPSPSSRTQNPEVIEQGHSDIREQKNGKKRIEKVTLLLPEEALYLVERGSMFCWRQISGLHDPNGIDNNIHSTPMTVQQAYTEMIGRDELTLERYQVYAYLKRLGYTVIRAKAPDPYYITGTACPSSERSIVTRRGFLSRLTTMASTVLKALLIPFRREMDWWDPSGVRKLMNNLTSYSFLFSKLRFIPSGYNKITPLTTANTSQTTSPYDIFYYFYKPITPYKKTEPPVADYAIAIVNGRKTPMPTIHELCTLFEQMPELPPPKPRKKSNYNQENPSRKPSSEVGKQPSNPQQSLSLLTRVSHTIFPFLRPQSSQVQLGVSGQSWRPNPFQMLKLGKKMVVVASVDNGLISFFRFGQGSFNEWPMI